jgi:hypothetical protein
MRERQLANKRQMVKGLTGELLSIQKFPPASRQLYAESNIIQGKY